MRYDQAWHDFYGEMTSSSARKILAYLSDQFSIRSAIEFGCGHAHWLQAAEHIGIGDIHGLDGPWTELENLRIDRKFFSVADLEKPVQLNRNFDLAICMEVAELLDQAASTIFVESISAHADLVLFGAAIPLQGGYRHINEQWPSYWAAIFRQLGYRSFDLVRPQFWTDDGVHYYYRQNALVYIRESAVELIQAAERAQLELLKTPPLDIVHPEKYMEAASYGQIALKRLIPRLPIAVWHVIRRRLPL